MSLDLLLGLQWGDEGKGKIVDAITSNYDIIARFQGGPNAGHTIELLLESGLVRKHQFGDSFSQYEKCYFNNQHDHIIITDTGEVKEFCDPRIQSIKNNIEEIFNVDIKDHSLYLYATTKKKK